MLKTRTSSGPIDPLDRVGEGGDVGFLARVEPEGVRFAPFRADAFGELVQRLHMTRTPCDADSEPFGGEGARDGRAEPVAGPDDHADGPARIVAHVRISLRCARGSTQKAISPCAR